MTVPIGGGYKKPAECPECGRDMKDVDPVGHAYYHYGESPLQPLPTNKVARENRAALLGDPNA